MANTNVITDPTIRALKTIIDQAEQDIPSIGHTLFKERYLPLLAQEPDRDAEGRIIPKDLSAWIEDIAKHPSNEVHVLDDSTGEIRYTVPPMVGTIATCYAASGEGLAVVSKEAIDRRAIHPVMGEKYLNSALACSFKTVPKYNKKCAEQWNKILVDHGYPGIRGLPTSTPTNQAQSITQDAPAVMREIADDDYEDL